MTDYDTLMSKWFKAIRRIQNAKVDATSINQ